MSSMKKAFASSCIEIPGYSLVDICYVVSALDNGKQAAGNLLLWYVSIPIIFGLIQWRIT